MQPSNLDRFPLPPDDEPDDGLDLASLYRDDDPPPVRVVEPPVDEDDTELYEVWQ